MEKRELYWDFMGIEMHQGRNKNFPPPQPILTQEDIWKREIAEMQKQIHDLQMRIVELTGELYKLKFEETDTQFDIDKIDKNQLEFNF